MFIVHRYCAIGKLKLNDKDVKVWSIPIYELHVNFKKYVLYRGALESAGNYYYKEKDECKDALASIKERSDNKAITKFVYILKNKERKIKNYGRENS